MYIQTGLQMRKKLFFLLTVMVQEKFMSWMLMEVIKPASLHPLDSLSVMMNPAGPPTEEGSLLFLIERMMFVIMCMSWIVTGAIHKISPTINKAMILNLAGHQTETRLFFTLLEQDIMIFIR